MSRSPGVWEPWQRLVCQSAALPHAPGCCFAVRAARAPVPRGRSPRSRSRAPHRFFFPISVPACDVTSSGRQTHRQTHRHAVWGNKEDLPNCRYPISARIHIFSSPSVVALFFADPKASILFSFPTAWKQSPGPHRR